MNRLVRLFWILLRSRWAPRCPPLGPATTRLRVWPNDLDVFLHVNNGVYLTLCDLARVDLMLRSGTLGFASGSRRVFLVAAETVQLYRPLTLFQRFSIDTRVIGWDEKAFFVDHWFWRETGRGREAVAHAVVEGRVHERSGELIPPATLLASWGMDAAPPPMPEWVERWRDDLRAMRREVRAGGR